MRKSLSSPFLALGAMFALVFALLAGLMTAFGQATPGATPADTNTTTHSAHIHAGMCPEPGDVVFPLENVVPVQQGEEADGTSEVGLGTPMSDLGTADAMSSPAAADAAMTGTPVASDTVVNLESTTVVEASLDDILGAEHAINVHQSPENLAVYIACGDITGEAENGELVVRLEELNDSNVEGQATLTDNGDGTTTVVIELRHVSVSAEGTPDATPKP